MRFYDQAECKRKANQQWEMAGLARQDHDDDDADNHTRKAREWDQRASEGGWEGNA